MDKGETDQQTVRRALLYLGDEDVAIGLRMPIYGEALLFRLIKNLQNAGIDDIAVAVESVPPELTALVDRFRAERLDVKLLRDGADTLAFAAQNGGTLLQNATIWASPELLAELVREPKSLILSLPEDLRFDKFERIDLARRWSGLAVLDGGLMRRSGSIPEGWSIDSTLLRAALQAGCPDRILGPSEALDKLVHLRSEDGAAQLARTMTHFRGRAGAAEGLSIGLADAAILKFAEKLWWRAAAEWTYPAFALSALGLALFAFPIAACWLGFAALIARTVRIRSREVSYRKPSGDWGDLAAITILLAALFTGLAIELSPFDAAFLSAATFALATVIAKSTSTLFGEEMSPVAVALTLALFASFGFAVLAVKLIVLALIGSLLLGSVRRAKLNAN